MKIIEYSNKRDEIFVKNNNNNNNNLYIKTT